MSQVTDIDGDGIRDVPNFEKTLTSGFEINDFQGAFIQFDPVPFGFAEAESESFPDSNGEFGRASATSILGQASAHAHLNQIATFQVPSSGEYEIIWDQVFINGIGFARGIDPLVEAITGNALVAVNLAVFEQGGGSASTPTKIIAHRRYPESLAFDTLQGGIIEVTWIAGKSLLKVPMKSIMDLTGSGNCRFSSFTYLVILTLIRCVVIIFSPKVACKNSVRAYVHDFCPSMYVTF